MTADAPGRPVTPADLLETVAAAMCIDAEGHSEAWDEVDDGLRQAWLSSAAAALAAVRAAVQEPTEAMLRAAMARPYEEPGEPLYAPIWRAMLLASALGINDA